HREYRECWVRGALGREQAPAGNVEIRDLVRLAVAVGDRVSGIGTHDRTAVHVDGRLIATTAPHLLGAGRLGDLHALLEVRVPQRYGILIVAVDDAPEWHAEFVLLRAGELDAIVDVGHLLAERAEAGEAACRSLHELGERRPKQVDARIG